MGGNRSDSPTTCLKYNTHSLYTLPTLSSLGCEASVQCGWRNRNSHPGQAQSEAQINPRYLGRTHWHPESP